MGVVITTLYWAAWQKELEVRSESDGGEQEGRGISGLVLFFWGEGAHSDPQRMKVLGHTEIGLAEDYGMWRETYMAFDS